MSVALQLTQPANQEIPSHRPLSSDISDLQRRFPELTAVAIAGVMVTADPWDNEFAFGLDRILDGIDVLVASLSQI